MLVEVAYNIMTRSGYPSNVTDEEWAIIEPLLPAAKSEKGRGRR
jgi:hypothetical protein